MEPSALSQSDTVIRPKSLSERLAAETPEPGEMAERFAPGKAEVHPSAFLFARR